MHDPAIEGTRWLEQADNDLAFARYALDGEYFHQTCFVCQQASEKALKAILYAGGARSVIGHALIGLLDRLTERHPDLEALRDAAAELDLFYIPTRYPNGLVEGAPHRAFTRAQAERAITSAEEIIEAARARVIAHPAAG